MSKKYYLTTPLYYVNSKPHIGHSYTNIAADALARFQRLSGQDVFFLTGTDEHGQKVEKASLEAGMKPKEFTDKIVATFKDLWKTLEISYDDFIRTTDDRHIETVKAVWKKLHEKGEIYQDTYSGFYCTPCEHFFGEAQALKENDQILCPDCKRGVEKIEEENYFFKISSYQDWLLKYIKGNPNFILPQTRRNEVIGFLENNPLQDLCISRPKSRLSWGIPSPISEDHVTYVWFDALLNYIAACKYATDGDFFKKWWPCDVHIIGKDILRHHAVYWPIILHALGVEPPKMIFAHGWWVQGGTKMSKSKGNVVDPVEVVKTYGVDPYRYFLLRVVTFGLDGTFSEEALIERFNYDLANDLGNLLHRTLTMCEKYFQGEVPKSTIKDESSDLKKQVDFLPSRLRAKMEALSFSEALEEIWKLINSANKSIETAAPWKLSKEGKEEELKLVISSLLEVLKIVAQAVWPFMPATGEGIWKQLGIQQPITEVFFEDKSWGFFKGGEKINKGKPLFPRIEIKKS